MIKHTIKTSSSQTWRDAQIGHRGAWDTYVLVIGQRVRVLSVFTNSTDAKPDGPNAPRGYIQ